MAKMNKPPDGPKRVRVVELNADDSLEDEIAALKVTDFITREDESDKDSLPAPVRTVEEDDIPDAGKVWFRVLQDGCLERWKQTPAD